MDCERISFSPRSSSVRPRSPQLTQNRRGNALKTSILVLIAVLFVFTFRFQSRALVVEDKAALKVEDVSGPQGRFLRQKRSETLRSPEKPSSEAESCGLYLAPSSFPSGGVGVYSNRFVPADGEIAVDAIVSLSDMDFHACEEFGALYNPWPPRNYAWDKNAIEINDPQRGAVGPQSEGLLDLEWLSFGLGAMANSNVHLVNLDEVVTVQYDESSSDLASPALGSFTPYPSRRFIAAQQIPQGSELFTFYGTKWYESRLGRPLYRKVKRDVPEKLRQDKVVRIAKVVTNFRQFSSTDIFSRNDVEITASLIDTVLSVVDALDPTLGSIFEEQLTEHCPEGLFPPRSAPARSLLLASVDTLARQYTNSIRPPEWLEAHGRCTDHIYGALSTIAEAGKGAFASRPLAKGTIVATSPLMLFPDRSALLMHPHPRGGGLDHLAGNHCADRVSEHKEAQQSEGDSREPPVGQQLLVNYAFGHDQTSVLLVPLAPGVQYINHASPPHEPNVAIRWPNDGVLNHNASYLTHATFQELAQTERPVLALEYVALRPIRKDQEILLDYGTQWRQAWENHLKNTRIHEHQPTKEVPASSFSRDVVIRTAHEREYPPNVYTKCRASYRQAHRHASRNTSVSTTTKSPSLSTEEATQLWEFHLPNKDYTTEEDNFHPCQVLFRDPFPSDTEVTTESEGMSHDSSARNDTDATPPRRKRGEYLYTAYISNSKLDFTVSTEWQELQQRNMGRIVKGIPRRAIVFRDKVYGRHHQNFGSFRHEIMLPNEMLPLAWMNRQ